jgi:zinc protease
MMTLQREGSPIDVHRAPSGATFIIKENHSTPIVSLALYVRGGVRAEDGSNAGITNFMQRMLMKGTERRSAEEIAGELEFLGASMAPFTGKDVFGATLTSLSKHFPQALGIFADCLHRPVFPESEAANERRVIISDIDKRRDDTLSHCLELCERALFEGHPYRFPITGQKESLEGLGTAALAAWHARFHAPSQMVVALVGDVEAGPAREMLEATFGVSGGATTPLPPYPPLAPLDRVRSVSDVRDKRQVAVALGFHGPAFGHDEYHGFDVLDHVLSGMGSRLFIELRDRQGLGYVVNCHFDSRHDVGAFKIYIGTSEERRERAREAMIEQLVRLREEPVGAEELERTQQYMLGLYEIALQRNGAQASRLAYYEIMGPGWRLLDEYAQRVRSVTSDDILRIARTWLDPARCAVSQITSG